MARKPKSRRKKILDPRRGAQGQTLSGTRINPDRPYNLIGHNVDWDGTLRSYKALQAIEVYHPKTGADIARIFLEEQNWYAEFPMFLENPSLVAFVENNTLESDQDRHYYITHWDGIDAVADMWKLSPELQAAYQSVDKYSTWTGRYIGHGWHKLIEEVRSIVPI